MRILNTIIIIVYISGMIQAQCTNIIQFPTSQISAPEYGGSEVVISNGQWAGDFAIVGSLTIGETYELGVNTSDFHITVRNAYDHSILLAHGPAPLNFTPASVDIVSVHYKLVSPPCGTATNSKISTISCLSCTIPPPTVGVNTNSPAASLDVNGEIKFGNSTRPAEAGMVRWNDSVNDFEGYNGENWISLTKMNNNSWGVLPVSNTVHEDQKITSNDGTLLDYFSGSVSIDGDFAIVGSRLSDIDGKSNQGAAYIFNKNGSTWTEQAKLTANDGVADDFFGESVSISGDFAIVSTYKAEVGGNSFQGAAYIFQRSGSIWTEQTKLTAIDGNEFDYFGYCVAIDGDIAIVGANNANVGGNNTQGAVYVFERNGSNWTEQAKLVASDGVADDWFGSSVDLNGDFVIVGTCNNDFAYNKPQGSTYIFKKDGNEWTEQIKLTASEGMEFDNFGYSVSIDGDYAIVGDRIADVEDNSQQGIAYIFNRSGNTWIEQTKLKASDGNDGDFFGTSVSIDNDFVIVGATYANIDDNSGQGAAYIFQRNESIWTEQVKLTSSDGDANDNFGESVSIAGKFTITGAINADIGVNVNQGAAYIIKKK